MENGSAVSNEGTILDTTVNSLLNATTEHEDNSYDSTGAMYFIVITICVYSLGIIAFIAGHIHRRDEQKQAELQISEYMQAEKQRSTRTMSYLLRFTEKRLIQSAVMKGEFEGMFSRPNGSFRSKNRTSPALESIEDALEECETDIESHKSDSSNKLNEHVEMFARESELDKSTSSKKSKTVFYLADPDGS